MRNWSALCLRLLVIFQFDPLMVLHARAYCALCAKGLSVRAVAQFFLFSIQRPNKVVPLLPRAASHRK